MINLDYLELYTGDAIVTNKTCHSYKDLVLRINYYEKFLQDFSNKKIAVLVGIQN